MTGRRVCTRRRFYSTAVGRSFAGVSPRDHAHPRDEPQCPAFGYMHIQGTRLNPPAALHPLRPALAERHEVIELRVPLPLDELPDMSVASWPGLAETSGSESLWNFLTLLHGLLTVQEVARQFEFNSLQQAVDDVRDSLGESAKSLHLAEIFAFGSTGEVLSAALQWIFPDSSPGASPAVDLAAFDQGAFEPPMMSLGLRRFQPRWVPKPRRASSSRGRKL